VTKVREPTGAEIQSRVLTLVEVAKAVTADPAEGVMALLTAAVYVHVRHARKDVVTEDSLASALGNAILTERGLFGRRSPTTGTDADV
jgi:hypothetical protein